MTATAMDDLAHTRHLVIFEMFLFEVGIMKVKLYQTILSEVKQRPDGEAAVGKRVRLQLLQARQELELELTRSRVGVQGLALQRRRGNTA